ncbi:MAG: DUF5615 family PIN-like protein [Nitrospira sp.]|nr:DUF5615 family PIN-like protein [Nitrospira sp.]
MPTRFKLDENLPRNAEALLLQAGHDVHTALAEQLGGHPDPLVFDASQTEERVLVTFDLDFSDIRVYPPVGHHGIWILRPHTKSIENTLALCDPRCEFLKMSLCKDDYGSSSPNGFVFMNRQ